MNWVRIIRPRSILNLPYPFSRNTLGLTIKMSSKLPQAWDSAIILHEVPITDSFAIFKGKEEKMLWLVWLVPYSQEFRFRYFVFFLLCILVSVSFHWKRNSSMDRWPDSLTMRWHKLQASISYPEHSFASTSGRETSDLKSSDLDFRMVRVQHRVVLLFYCRSFYYMKNKLVIVFTASAPAEDNTDGTWGVFQLICAAHRDVFTLCYI